MKTIGRMTGLLALGLTALVSGCSSLNPLVSNHLEAGVRSTYFQLAKTHKAEGFVGTIRDLKAEQNLTPNLLLNYNFNQTFGAELSWSKLRADAVTSEIGSPGPSDGFFELSGPSISLIGKYPNSTRFTPHAGAGVVFYKGNFDHAGWWKNGYAKPEDYENLGPEPRNGKTRKMLVEDTIGYGLQIGSDIKLGDRWQAGIDLSYTMAETDAYFEAFIKGNRLYHKGPFEVPFDNTSIGLGLKYKF